MCSFLGYLVGLWSVRLNEYIRMRFLALTAGLTALISPPALAFECSFH
jgi:hypothetical protein